MKVHEQRRNWPTLSVSMAALGLLAGGLLAGTPASAAGAVCSVAGLTGLGIANVSIAAAIERPAAAPNPAFCDVFGAVVTTGHGAPDGLARFEMQLPAN